MVAANAGLGFVGSVGGHLIDGSDFSSGQVWIDIIFSTAIGAGAGYIGGAGALNATSLNNARKTSGFLRAAASYDKVLTRVISGGYKTAAAAKGALRFSGWNLTYHWNKMVLHQAGRAVIKSFVLSNLYIIPSNLSRASGFSNICVLREVLI